MILQMIHPNYKAYGFNTRSFHTDVALWFCANETLSHVTQLPDIMRCAIVNWCITVSNTVMLAECRLSFPLQVLPDVTISR